MSQSAFNERVTNAMNDFDSEIKKKERERELQKKRESFGVKIDTLADRVINYMQDPQYGPDHFLTKLMKNCLAIAISVKELTENLTAIYGAMDTVTDAIGLIDDLVNLDGGQMEALVGTEYTVFSRFKAWRTARKARRNQKRRMKMVVSNIKLKLDIANDMLVSMGRMAVDMEKMFNGGKKGKTDPNADAGLSAADKYIMDRAAATGTTVNTGSTGGGAPAPSAPSGGSAPSGSTGIDGL